MFCGLLENEISGVRVVGFSKTRPSVHSTWAQTILNPGISWWAGICGPAFHFLLALTAKFKQIRDFWADYPPGWGYSISGLPTHIFHLCCFLYVPLKPASVLIHDRVISTFNGRNQPEGNKTRPSYGKQNRHLGNGELEEWKSRNIRNNVMETSKMQIRSARNVGKVLVWKTPPNSMWCYLGSIFPGYFFSRKMSMCFSVSSYLCLSSRFGACLNNIDQPCTVICHGSATDWVSTLCVWYSNPTNLFKVSPCFANNILDRL